MRIRFLELCESDNPDAPFQPGQIIQVDQPSRHLQRLIDRGLAAVVIDEERAIEPDPEQPELPRVKGRTRVPRL